MLCCNLSSTPICDRQFPIFMQDSATFKDEIKIICAYMCEINLARKQCKVQVWDFLAGVEIGCITGTSHRVH
jgi:hypothetical protein